MSFFSRLFSDYGMLLVLVVLCLFLTFATWDERRPEGESAGEQVAELLLATEQPQRVLIVARRHASEQAFVAALEQALVGTHAQVLDVVQGEPADARQAIERLLAGNEQIDAIACSSATVDWTVFSALQAKHAALADVQVVAPRAYRWSKFLTSTNLLNIAGQIAVIAIIAVGMTMVVITGGIDLSVGSLVALSAVVIARCIRDFGGGQQATVFAMLAAGAFAVALCAAVGLFSGTMVTLFRAPPNIPPFIVTLGVMQIASGAAWLISEGQSINQVPDSFTWIGREASIGIKNSVGIPNAVLLMIAVYAAAHVLMSHTTLGRYIYAVGGNAEAARLSGIQVRRVLLFVYTLSGALAGLGGVVLASQLKAGAPTYGMKYELSVIAAVVVGGTSLAGGEGRILGTLIGAFIIAVIQNGMNLLGLESYTQLVVLGSVILLAVLLDRFKKQFA
jgi:ribose transport system permease protein